MVFRALRTRYSEGLLSDRCTRATERPSTPFACSRRTPAIGPWRDTSLRASLTLTLRMSITTVSGSGRFTE